MAADLPPLPFFYFLVRGDCAATPLCPFSPLTAAGASSSAFLPSPAFALLTMELCRSAFFCDFLILFYIFSWFSKYSHMQSIMYSLKVDERDG